MLLPAVFRTRAVVLLALLHSFCLSSVGQSQVADFVLPLLTTAWGQDAPYNQQCPEKPDDQGTLRHCRVGCVACAMGQVMNYHQYPTVGTGTGTNLFNTSLTVNYGATYYAWADMLDSYATAYTPAQAEAVSTLLFHCGVAVNMIYGLQSSSTFTAFANNMTTALSRYFGYDATTLRTVSRSKYTKAEWLQLIREELSAGRPIIYSGNSDTMGGHTWVVDGYDAAGRVHMNWGWLGLSNDYYDIDLDVPGLDFNRQQSMFIGIQPKSDGTGVPTVMRHDGTAVYDLYGRRVRPTASGLYVKDGKKMVINIRQ